MKYLFFDLEYATSRYGINKICEFGYVLTDENFNILQRNNLIINPHIKRQNWNYRVVKKILRRNIKQYEQAPKFLYCYDQIKEIIDSADYVIGHTLNGDAKALNDECIRYQKPSIDFDFYDVRLMYMKYTNSKTNTSLKNMVEKLEIDGENTVHDAGTDAYNTMLVLKTLLKRLNVSFEEIIRLYPNSKDRSANYSVDSLEASAKRKERMFKETLHGDGTNNMKPSSVNHRRFLEFLDNVRPTKEGIEKFKSKKVLISTNYEEHHFKQMIHLTQMIVNEKGMVVLDVKAANVFVQFDFVCKDKTIMPDPRYDQVNEANQQGANIEIISFNELLKRLSITEEELNALKPISFDFLFKKGAVINNKRDKANIEMIKRRALVKSSS